MASNTQASDSDPSEFTEHESARETAIRQLNQAAGFLDEETGKLILPLYCPDCYGKIQLKEVDQENLRGSGTLYGCLQCAEIFMNRHYGPVIPRDHYGDHVIEWDFYEIEGPPESTNSTDLTCPDCLAAVQLQEA